MQFHLWIIGSALLYLGQTHGASICFVPLGETKGLEGWALEAGVAVITTNNIGDVLSASAEKANGEAGGEIYSITASRTLGELRWIIGGHTFAPQLEIPLTLEIVDENGSDPFAVYNVAFAVRWVDFPWSDMIKTTFMMGIGLSYSEKVFQIDKDRHDGDYRSNLKFDWPIQLTLAMPERPGQQITIYVIHHSGGHTFDVGGINCVGMGYRHQF